MESPTSLKSEMVQLFNPAYITNLGVKEIQLNKKTALVHETGYLRELVDAYHHRLGGRQPADFLAEVIDRRLDDPEVFAVIKGFTKHHSELSEVLRDITRQRDVESEARRNIRNREVGRATLGARFSAAVPTPKAEAHRDFIYSQVLDEIGDMTHRGGFDLLRLL